MFSIEPYTYYKPLSYSDNIYHFINKFGTEYEVTFARLKTNLFHVKISFGTLNGQTEDEPYALTNENDHYKVLTTVSIIILEYIKDKPQLNTVEFTALNQKGESADSAQKRLKLYSRYFPKIFPEKQWKMDQLEHCLIFKKRKGS